MKKHIKSIIALAVCIIAVLWLIPTIFVETTISQIKSYELVQSGQQADTYLITYTYERDGQTKESTYKDRYSKNYIPMINEQDVCHYLTLPPYTAFIGDASSPVPPLVLLVFGILIYFGKLPKRFRKKEKTDEPQA